VATVRAHAPGLPSLQEVLFCCFTDADLALYEARLARD
jgi:hypothetical protein